MRYRSRWVLVSVVVVRLTSVAGAQTQRGGVQLSSARDRAAALQNESVGGPFNSVCTAGTAFGSNILANCDSVVLPHNETAIIADPNDPSHVAAGSNDRQLPPNGATGGVRSALGYYTSFNGGKTGSTAQGRFANRSYQEFLMAEIIQIGPSLHFIAAAERSLNIGGSTTRSEDSQRVDWSEMILSATSRQVAFAAWVPLCHIYWTFGLLTLRRLNGRVHAGD